MYTYVYIDIVIFMGVMDVFIRQEYPFMMYIQSNYHDYKLSTSVKLKLKIPRYQKCDITVLDL